MQTFLPYADFKKSAQCLDYRRLGKQRVEAWQIYNTLQQIKKRNNRLSYLEHITELKSSNSKREYDKLLLLKIPWENHPAVQMWRGHEYVLLLYMEHICIEWINRGFKDTMLSRCKNEQSKFSSISGDILAEPPWLNDKRFHRSHKSNLMRKDEEHYSKYFKEWSNLDYFWPTKDEY